MQPNRLERVWKFVSPEILKQWPQLAGDDLKSCQCQYDLVVETIRETCFIGRSHLSLEAEIRDWLNAKIAFYEKHFDKLSARYLDKLGTRHFDKLSAHSRGEPGTRQKNLH